MCKSRDYEGQCVSKKAFANSLRKVVSAHSAHVSRPEQIKFVTFYFVTFDADTFEQIDNLFYQLLKMSLVKNNPMITRDVVNNSFYGDKKIKHFLEDNIIIGDSKQPKLR